MFWFFREQRVTGICVFLLTGLSVKLAPILKYIPMPVLYGVLMYMGVNTLNGMQFIDRLALMLMPGKHQPDYIYLRHVPLKKVELPVMELKFVHMNIFFRFICSQ